MEKHFELSDAEFEKQFADVSMDPTLFGHEAHLRLAWIHITKYGAKEAIDRICAQIEAFASAYGASDKYNVTVTIAAVRAVYHFILRSESENFGDFILEFPQLKHKFKALLNSHYSIDIFAGQAKKEYIPPDLLPFDEIPASGQDTPA